MRKAAFILLVFLSLVVLVIEYGYKPFSQSFGLEEKAGIRIEANTEAKVSIDNKEIGKSPLQQENLEPKEHLVALSSDKGSWQGYVKLNPGTLTVVSRELALSVASSSGEVITLNKGKGAMVISNPSQAQVEVDGKTVGQTPLSLSDLTTGSHLFIISHPNYLKKSVRGVVAEGYTLNLNVDLAISEADLTQVATVPISSTSQVVVKQTPTGFLRIRDNPSTSANEVGQVATGGTLTLLEELPEWDRVRTSDGKEGFVFSQYVTKKSQ